MIRLLSLLILLLGLTGAGAQGLKAPADLVRASLVAEPAALRGGGRLHRGPAPRDEARLARLLAQPGQFRPAAGGDLDPARRVLGRADASGRCPSASRSRP